MLVYRDFYISVFYDDDKLLVVYVTRDGKTRVLNVDDNFYSVEDNIRVYKELIDMTADEEERNDYLGTYLNYTIGEVRAGGQDLDYEFLHHIGIECEKILRTFREVEHNDR